MPSTPKCNGKENEGIISKEYVAWNPPIALFKENHKSKENIKEMIDKPKEILYNLTSLKGFAT
jgi:hypothetical protein